MADMQRELCMRESPHPYMNDSIEDAIVDLRGFVAEEMFDKDDRALLFEITSDGQEQVVDSYLPL